ncbi:MAG: DUF3299 domain-containing protein [Saprospiraceae bacterium]|nr:DUF3299 domain-containing protein [Saprospiraceae bacterium]
MLKKISIQLGFVMVLIGVVFLLQPNLATNLLGNSSPEENNSIDNISEQIDKNRAIPTKKVAKKEDYIDPRAPSLIANKRNSNFNPDIKDGMEVNDYTAYAEGYSKDDFGDAFNPPENNFQIDTESDLPSPGGVWDDLLTLEFKFLYDASIDDVIQDPQFTPRIKKHEGQKIELYGYIVPFDIVENAMGNNGDGTMFMLSAYPAQTCFFCGGAGPESIIEVYPDEPIHYTKDRVTIEGVLELNNTDFLRMAYILKDAKLIRE